MKVFTLVLNGELIGEEYAFAMVVKESL